MGVFHEYERFLALTPAIVLWGCFGGICLAAVNFFLIGLWTSALNYNNALIPVYYFQIIVSFVVLLLALGVIASDLFYTGRDIQLNPAIIGLLSGTCTAFVYVIIIGYHDFLSNPQNIHYANDIFLTSLFLNRFLQYLLTYLAGFLLISGILQAIGSRYQGSGLGRAGIVSKPVITGILQRHRFLLVALFAILVIPSGIVYLGTGAGVMKKDSMCCIFNDRVETSRTGPDSIQIVMKPYPDVIVSASDQVPFVKIFLDKKDVSTQSIISGSELADTIDPPEGLLYREDASVTLHGKDVSGNETSPVHLEIIVTYPSNKGESIIMCDRDI
jgi:hypothetical protein